MRIKTVHMLVCGLMLVLGGSVANAQDASWAEKLEKRSHERGKPNQIAGWRGGDSGSVVAFAVDVYLY